MKNHVKTKILRHFPPELAFFCSIHEILFWPVCLIFWEKINRCNHSSIETICLKYMLQCIIGFCEVFISDSLTIRGVCDETSPVFIGYFRNIRFSKANSIEDSCSRCIFASNIYHAPIPVTSIYFIGFIVFLWFCFFYCFLMTGKIVPREIEVIEFSLEPWCYIPRNHGCFYQYSSASAHRIIQWCAKFPATKEDECRSKWFFYRSLPCFCTISPLVECISWSIDEDMELIADEQEKYLNRMTVFIFFPVVISSHEGTYNSFLPYWLHARCMRNHRSACRRRNEYRCSYWYPFGPVDLFDNSKEHF